VKKVKASPKLKHQNTCQQKLTTIFSHKKHTSKG
jgi:hypothetical protein